MLPEGKTLFDMIPDAELDILMKFGVGNTPTRKDEDHQDLFRKLAMRDNDPETGVGVPDILALGETLPHTMTHDPYEL